jgi:endonuclease YncB( thermonuclease family)
VADLCHEQLAKARRQTTERYGRMIARVSCAGKDASTEQVQAGLAWACLSTSPIQRSSKQR